jgi:hypothetical protein
MDMIQSHFNLWINLKILFLTSTLINSHLLSSLSESFLTKSVIYLFFLIPKFMSVLCENNFCVGLHRPLGLQNIEPPRISKQPAHKRGKVVSPTHRPPLLPRKYSWYSFVSQAESTPGP